jgi:hypothetical protein
MLKEMERKGQASFLASYNLSKDPKRNHLPNPCVQEGQVYFVVMAPFCSPVQDELSLSHRAVAAALLQP